MAENLPPEQSSQETSPGYQAMKDDDFLKNLKIKTEGDEKIPPPISKQSEKKNEVNDSDLSASLVLNLVDVVVQIACQAISEEKNHELFKVSQAQKDQIEKPLVQIFERYKLEISPWLLLITAVIVVYSAPVMKAVSLKNQKERAKKTPVTPVNDAPKQSYPVAPVNDAQKEVERILNTKRPGRPHGTTKHNMSSRIPQKNK